MTGTICVPVLVIPGWVGIEVGDEGVGGTDADGVLAAGAEVQLLGDREREAQTLAFVGLSLEALPPVR